MTLDEFHPDTTHNPSARTAIQTALHKCGIEGDQIEPSTTATLRIVSAWKPFSLPIYPIEQYEAAAELVAHFIAALGLTTEYQILVLPSLARHAGSVIDLVDQPC